MSAATMRPGGSITATVRASSARATAHNAVLRMSASGGASVSPGSQGLGSVGGGGASALVTVRAAAAAKPGTITLTARLSASKAATRTRSYKLVITDASGAPPPGTDLPSGVPPLTGSGGTPFSSALPGVTAPQVALPPVTSPQIAPSAMPMVPVAGLRPEAGDDLSVEDLMSIQAGFLAAMTASVTLLLLRLQLSRRAGAPLRRSGRLHLQLAGKRITEARLRTLPSQPAPVRSLRIAWPPLKPTRAVRL
ncbi:hypothetical protein [Spirillospora sp. NBC_01491]|uniref:hypothetical protein n=1 Tax=Spirillospora sp. NBC_01491 TaxID=2976007 RepID=UPI002E35C34F|nr:hypothetical protein [Spirillospora sp. NBC_01491]